MKSRCSSTSSAATWCGPQAAKARFVGPNRIEVTAEEGETRMVSAAHILIACGTRPFRPDYVPFDGKTVFDSDEIIDLPKLPRSLAVIGAGVIGVEYATIFSALDVAVTLIEPRPTFLDFIDKELIEEFMHECATAMSRCGWAPRSIRSSAAPAAAS
jgi:NAD(P) transhydrogenase